MKTYTSILFILWLPVWVIAQSQFVKTYGGMDFDQAAGIVPTNDGGYFIAGYSASFDSSGASIYLIKIDSLGFQIFSKTYGGSAYDIPTGLVATYDGGFTICGITWNAGAGDSDAFLLKTDGAGNIRWMKTFGSITREKPFSMTQTSDSGFVIAGYTKYDASSPEDDKKIFVIKTDSLGNLLWHKTYGGPVYDEATSIIETFDKGFLVGGLTIGSGAINNDCVLIKTDNEGNIIWTKVIGTIDNEVSNDIIQVADSGYVMIGSCEDCGYGAGDILLVRLSSTGEVLWSKCLGTIETESSSKIVQATNGDLILMGLSIKSSVTDIILSTISLQDTSLTSILFGTYGNQHGNSLLSLDDGSIIITGESNTEADPIDDVLVLKIIDNETNCFTLPYNMEMKPVTLLITDSIQLFTKAYLEGIYNPTEFTAQTLAKDFCLQNFVYQISGDTLKIYPNPFLDYIHVSINGPPVINYKMYDSVGRIVLNMKLENQNNTIDCSFLSNGVYFYHLSYHHTAFKSGLLIKNSE